MLLNSSRTCSACGGAPQWCQCVRLKNAYHSCSGGPYSVRDERAFSFDHTIPAQSIYTSSCTFVLRGCWCSLESANLALQDFNPNEAFLSILFHTIVHYCILHFSDMGGRPRNSQEIVDIFARPKGDSQASTSPSTLAAFLACRALLGEVVVVSAKLASFAVTSLRSSELD